jgi:hypothetical protein
MNTHAIPTIIAQLSFPLDYGQILLWIVILVPLVLLVVFAVTSILAVDVAKAISNTIISTFQQLVKIISPPKWDSWQALIWVSFFSWAVSMVFRTQWMQSLAASISWLFLIPGVHWFTHVEKLEVAPKKEVNVKKGLSPNGFFLGPWITGALICLFLFGGLTDNMGRQGFVLWPLISATIAILPEFIQFGPTYKLPDDRGKRQASIQKIALIVLSNLVLSCWLQFCFATQSWLDAYPSITTTDVSRSSFVVKLDPSQTTPKGVNILNQAGFLLQEEMNGRSWSWVERWLLNVDQQTASMQQTIMTQLPKVEENELWQLKGRVAAGTEYTLRLFAIWQGPTADEKGYYLTKDCYITKVAGNRLPPGQSAKSQSTTGLASVQCAQVQGPFNGQPNLEQVLIQPDNRGSW